MTVAVPFSAPARSTADADLPSPRMRGDDDARGLPDLVSLAELEVGPSDDEPAALPWSLADATNRQLRRWSNQLYRALDTEAPPYGAADDFKRVIDELERREGETRGSAGAAPRGTFRDNPMNHRFELFRDGVLAGYVSYSMRAGTVRLHRTVIAAAFEGAGLEQTLIRNVLLNAHKRRLSALPYCSEVQAFLAGNPQYRVLLDG
ncbi:N-acetyltransferase [Arthrobacter agilis]|uniref:GNAT family N-acetyltransferase n=1 Tax=Arthrobacter agilis TaxID=37921 RepID=UPI002366726B|nr:N-acetyltransferase [Arthrobacter agilis]WDF32594.1 N-acetyltransferase [Arthrobacter agilis]